MQGRAGAVLGGVIPSLPSNHTRTHPPQLMQCRRPRQSGALGLHNTEVHTREPHKSQQLPRVRGASFTELGGTTAAQADRSCPTPKRQWQWPQLVATRSTAASRGFPERTTNSVSLSSLLGSMQPAHLAPCPAEAPRRSALPLHRTTHPSQYPAAPAGTAPALWPEGTRSPAP